MLVGNNHHGCPLRHDDLPLLCLLHFLYCSAVRRRFLAQAFTTHCWGQYVPILLGDLDTGTGI